MMTNHVVEADDLARLYRTLAHQLERIVGTGVPTPDVVDDACQFAWAQLVLHCDRVQQEAALAWLTTTAVREAFRLIRIAEREPSLEALLGVFDESALTGVAVSVEEWFESKERLMALGALPARQQRLLWLQAMGLTYAEMAVHEGATRRTVERQVLRARARVRLSAAR
jgi:RNA polymerase sigma factor (sigma-70 family)